ncbi:MAG: hypothetical protein PHT69_04250 [Bacteroidales bacterium]|nr:hypothetical protein [Bacteroidales bacterium]
MSKSIVFLFIILNLSFNSVISQDLPDYQWWAEAHNWDGVTHWSRYIKRLPGYMGPNALPIPSVNDAKIKDNIYFESAFEYHKGRGEFAMNPFFNLNIPVANKKVSIDFIYRPFEYYETEEFIRQERYGRNRECKDIAKGDLYIGTFVQLLSEEYKALDAQLRIVLKTTTGKDLANGRHTDAPAYHFDLNLGKTIFENDGFLKKMNFYSMAGLYVWQMEFDNNRQNDAYLYGLRTDFLFKPLLFSCTFSGYSGYMKMRDKPMALRLTISKSIKNSFIFLSYQKGLRDVIEHSFRMGLNFSFNLHK